MAFQDVLGKEFVESRNTSAIGLELDIYIPTYSLAIEPGSWLYHESKVATYDSEKRKECKKAGIRLVTVYDTYPLGVAPPFDNDCYVYDGFLNEPGYGRIIAFLKKMMESLNLNHNGIDWQQIANKAYAACHYNVHDFLLMLLPKHTLTLRCWKNIKAQTAPLQ